MNYDKLTDEYFNNPKLIWQHTISGEKNFDSCDFLGALKDLSSVPDWRDAFIGLEDSDLFLDRVAAFFGHNGDLSPDKNGRQSLYFSPKTVEISPVELVKLAKQYLEESAKVSAFSNESPWNDEEDWPERLAKLPVEWISPDHEIEVDDYNDCKTYLYEIWSEVYSDNSKPWSHIHYCLSEACYGLAADYALQRYLMEDFYKLDFNLSYLYALEWVHGGKIFFNETKCFVTNKKTQ